MQELPWNRSILCVDDEKGILEAYVNTLIKTNTTPPELQDKLSLRRLRRKGESYPNSNTADTADTADTANTEESSPDYTVFTASSGEEAIEIVKRELVCGQQIAVGFFDMIMPGGIDGQETIKRILQLDSQMLCAVVTAYTDRSPDQIGRLFPKQDAWLYFNKPFSTGELLQTANNLVTGWNQRRKEEALISNLECMRKGLMHILNSVNDINQIPPMMLDNLLEAILNHFLKLTQSQDGFLVLSTNGKQPFFQIGSGVFKKYASFMASPFEKQWAIAEKSIERRLSVIDATMAATPLKIGEEVLGVLFIQKEQSIQHDPQLLDIFAIQAVNIIRNFKLYEELEVRNIELSKRNQELLELLGKLSQSEQIKDQFEKLSYLDALTGIANRRFLEIRFREEIARCQRHGFSVGCLMIDIDYFKQVNDTYGHSAGDYVLQEMGKLLMRYKRPYDVAARYGGEEFVLLLKQISMEDAFKVGERIRSTVERRVFFFEGKILKITISIGATALKPGNEDTMESVIKLTDEALYMAKNSGRNQIRKYAA